MPEEKHGYKMHMIVPKPTDPEKLKKREELSKRLKEYPNEALKKALEWIQAKKEQEEREKPEREEKVSFIENLDLQTSGEKLWKFSDWKFIFNEGIEKDDGNWKYIEIIEKRYYEWSEGIDWFWYRCVLHKNWHYCLFCWEFKDGHILRWIQIFDNWNKYVGQFKNDAREWQWIYTWADWYKYVGQWKNDEREWQWTFTWANWEKYVGQFKNGVMDWEWTYTWPDWDKYVGQFKNDEREWQWTYTCVNWNILTWIWKDDSISEGKMKLKSDGTEIDVVRDRGKGLWKVTTEWEYKDKYINYTTWEFIEP